ncbi:hypothetical protein [Deinococcus sp.]|uniref:hypothetical protein n=1 Tax=Deinococcus sp. TaxID=47478 RepID=UPI003C7A51A5
MAGHTDLYDHLQSLLAAELWKEALLHLRLAAQQVGSRSEARALGTLLDRFPAEAELLEEWPNAVCWVAYRTANFSLLERALFMAPARLPAFEAFRASGQEGWSEALRWGETPGIQDQKEAAIAARFRACALAELHREGWQDAYRRAVHLASGRDRGLVLSELAHYLSSSGQEAAARDAYAQAIPELRRDAWCLTLTYANLGITCLRLGALQEAERALRAAALSGQQGDGIVHLTTVWRGLGGLALHRGQLARAHHAFGYALRKAASAAERLAARRGSARVYRMQGLFDEAMAELYDALRQDHAPDQPHPFSADLAALDLLVGDLTGARRRLKQVQVMGADDGWRVRVVQAELARRTGAAHPVSELRDLNLEQTWAQEEARVFPELFALLGLKSERPQWTAQLSADGPLSLTMSGGPVPLRSGRASASLLAFLVYHRGEVSAERALEALSLPGKDVRARKQQLSKAVAELREVLGWPGALRTTPGLLALSKDVTWVPLQVPPPERRDLFCEGRLDPWTEEWKSEHDSRRLSAAF